MLERVMAGKNKGGREIRKPKQPKKSKSTEVLGIAKTEAPKKPR
jgi:hypothetical protein